MRALGDYGQRLAAGLRQSAQVRPGCLILCDDFSGPQAHGRLAAQAAGRPVVAVSLEDAQDPDFLERHDRLAQAVEGWGTAEEPAAIRQQLYEAMVATRLVPLETATDRLLAVAASGVRQAALNLSLGSTPAMAVLSVLDMCASPEVGEQALGQLSRAFSGELPKLHEGLVEMAQRSSSDERLVQARSEFAEAVRVFEEGHNSVVVAAGNDGNVGGKLLCAVPEGFSRSDFVTPEVTVVGALEGSYTSDPASVNVWASGVAAPGIEGTSFAAPRVAARLAELHGQQPELSSEAASSRL